MRRSAVQFKLSNLLLAGNDTVPISMHGSRCSISVSSEESLLDGASFSSPAFSTPAFYAPPTEQMNERT